MTEKRDGRGMHPNSRKHRIKGGEVRNPNGRPYGAVGFYPTLRKAMLREVSVTENGEQRKMTLLEAFVEAGMKHGMRGNEKFFHKCLDLVFYLNDIDVIDAANTEAKERLEFFKEITKLYHIHHADLMNLDEKQLARVIAEVRNMPRTLAPLEDLLDVGKKKK